jgi:hypothetical protein
VVDTFTVAVRSQLFDWVIIDRPTDSFTPYYVEAGEVPDEFYPVTGRFTRPETILMRNPVARGGKLDLTDARLNPLFGAGWGAPESFGRSMAGTQASVTIAVERDHAYRLEFDLFLQCGGPFQGEFMRVRWNGAPVGQLAVARCGSHQLSSLVPAALIRPGPNTLQVEFDPSRSPGGDPGVGVGFTRIRLVQTD